MAKYIDAAINTEITYPMRYSTAEEKECWHKAKLAERISNTTAPNYGVSRFYQDLLQKDRKPRFIKLLKSITRSNN